MKSQKQSASQRISETAGVGDFRPFRPFRLLALILLTYSLTHFSFAPPVNFRIMDQSGTNVLRTTVRFTSLTNPQESGTNIFAQRDFTRANTNSPLQVNLHEGRWRIAVGPLNWTIAVPSTNQLYEASDLNDSGLVTFTYTNTFGVVAGSNAVVFSTNGVYVINSTATGGTGSGTFDFASLTNKPAPIHLVATNDASTLTNLSASNLASGTVPDARLSSAVELNVTNVAELLLSTSTRRSVFVQGYTTPGDHGGGEFRYDATSSATTNLGTVFAHASGTGRWLRILKGDDIYVEDFGASGTSSDNADAINAALRWWIYETGTARKGKIRFRTQSYSISNAPVMIAKTNALGTGFDQVYGLTLEADAPTPNRSISAEIVQLNTNLPAVIVQYGDSIEIKNLNLRGLNTVVGEGRVNTVAQQLDAASWLSAVYPVRTNQYSPHAALVTDPFANYTTLSNANQYPGLSAYYLGTSGGTAKVRINNISVADFYVAFALNPNPCPTLAQGDGIVFDHVGIQSCAYGWSIGQSESKANTLRDCNGSYVMIMVTTRGFGQGLGCAPSIMGGQFGFTTLFDVQLGRGRLTVENMYTEGLISLGNVGTENDGNNEPVLFSGCDLRFATQTGVRAGHFGFLGPVVFDSCNIAATFNTINFVNDLTSASARGNVTFRNCRILSANNDPVSAIVFTTERNVRWEDCFVFDDGLSYNAAQLRDNIKTSGLTNYNRNFMPFGALLSDGLTNYASAFDLVDAEPDVGTWVFGGDGTATAVATSPQLLKSNDMLICRQSISGTVGAYLGRVATISGTSVTLQDVPNTWSNQTVTSMTIRRMRRFHQPTTGYTVSGEYSITNVSKPTAWEVGDAIRGYGIVEGTHITNISGTTFGISAAPSSTAQIDLFDAYYRQFNHTNMAAAAIIQPFFGITNNGSILSGPVYVTNASGGTAAGVLVTNINPTLVPSFTWLSGNQIAQTNGDKYVTVASGKVYATDGYDGPSGSLMLKQGGVNTIQIDSYDFRPSSAAYNIGRINIPFGTVYASNFVQSGSSGKFTGDGSGLTNLSGVSATSFWWTNTDAAASISNAYAVKATSFAGSGPLITGLNPANISAGTAGISITGNAVSATTATTANAGDSATAFFPSGTIEPARLATNAATAGKVLKATSATTAEWGTELSVAQATNYDSVTITNYIHSKDGDVRFQITDQETAIAIGGWNAFAANTNQDYAIMSSDDALASVKVNGDGSANVEVTGNLIVSGSTTFNSLSMGTATFTNAIFASNQPPATITPGNGFVMWFSNNTAPYYVIYDNAGDPVSTNAFGGSSGSTETVVAGTNGIAVVEAPSGTFTVHHTGNFDVLTATNLNVATAYITNLNGTASGATNAINATNIFGAGLTSMTNAALTVVASATNAATITASVNATNAGNIVFKPANNAFSGSNNFGGNTTFALPPLGNGAALTNIQGSNTTFTGALVANLPTPAAGYFPINYCTDVLTPAGSGGYVRYDGSKWVTLNENILATTSLTNYMASALSNRWHGYTRLSYSQAFEQTAENSGAGYTPWSSANSGTGSALSHSSASGIDRITFQMGTTAGAYVSGSGYRNTLAAGDVYGLSARLVFGALTNATDTFWFLIGKGGSQSATYGAEFVGFVYDPVNTLADNAAGSGNWLCVTRTGSTSTAVNSGLAASASTYATLSFVYTTTAVVFFTNGIPCVTNTANVPAGSTQLFDRAAMLRTAGSAYTYTYLDHFVRHMRHATDH